MELQSLHSLGKGTTVGTAGFQEASKTLHTTPVPAFHCPSRRPAKLYPSNMTATGGVFSHLVALGQGAGIVKTDYAASSGDSRYSASSDKTATLAQPGTYADADGGSRTNPLTAGIAKCDDSNDAWYQTGVSHFGSEITLPRIEDGTSNTYMVGEKWVSPDQYDGTAGANGTPGFSWGENQCAYTGWEWDQHRVAAKDTLSATDAETRQPSQDQAGVFNDPEVRFGSAHAGGLNMVFCDGSVHSISYDIDYKTNGYLANRLDGQSPQIP
jgi:prepilin-type processing-associated H-X9-DG protein